MYPLTTSSQRCGPLVLHALQPGDSSYELGQVRYVLKSPQKCSCVDTGRQQKKLIGTVSVRVFDVCATKLHISHEPFVRRHRFSMTTKSPTLNISVFLPSWVWFFHTHPHMYHQRSTPSRIHWHLHVKGVVSCPPCTVQPWWKSLRKSFVIHWFERSTVWCWLLVLKMSSSTTVHAHKSWPSWLWRHNPSPPSHFRMSWRRLFVVPTLGGNFLRTTWKRVDGLHFSKSWRVYYESMKVMTMPGCSLHFYSIFVILTL